MNRRKFLGFGALALAAPAIPAAAMAVPSNGLLRDSVAARLLYWFVGLNRGAVLIREGYLTFDEQIQMMMLQAELLEQGKTTIRLTGEAFSSKQVRVLLEQIRRRDFIG